MKNYGINIKRIILRNLIGENFWIFLFGSRATGESDDRADYDVGIFSNLGKAPSNVMNKIECELEESDIPYKVDVVDFADVSDRFKQIAGRSVIIWMKPERQSPPDWMCFKKR